MTLQTSFPLSASDINVELGRSAGAAITITGSSERALAEVPSGPIAFSDFLGKPTGGGVASGAFLAVSNQASGSSINFTSVSFGAAAATRRIFCYVHWSYNGGVHFPLSSATIGGVSATIHTQGGHSGGINGFGAAIISAAVPTGTSGTVATSFSSTVSASIAAFRVINLQNGSPTDTQSGGNSGATGNIVTNTSVAAGGVLFVVYHASNNGGSAYNSMVGSTERYTGAPPNNGVGGFNTGLGSQTRTVTILADTISNAGNQALTLSWS